MLCETKNQITQIRTVLILVVMEYALRAVPYTDTRTGEPREYVLILVVMEYALRASATLTDIK